MPVDFGLLAALFIAAVAITSFLVIGLKYKQGLELFSLGWLLTALACLLIVQPNLIDPQASVAGALALAFVGIYLHLVSLLIDRRPYHRLVIESLLIALLGYSLMQIGVQSLHLWSALVSAQILLGLLYVALGLVLIVSFSEGVKSRRQLGCISVVGGSILALDIMPIRDVGSQSISLLGTNDYPSRLLSDETLVIIALLALVSTIIRFGEILRQLYQDISLTVAKEKLVHSEIEQQLALGHLDQSRSLSMLSATLAHELNQPLTAIISNVGLAQRYLESSDRNSELLESLASDIERDIRRTSVLLDHHLGRHSSLLGTSEATNELTDVLATIRSVVQWLEPQIEKAGAVCQIRSGSISAHIPLKEVYLSQVLVNVIRNSTEALQAYQGVEKKILINVSEVANDIVISISDTGPGMDEKDLKNIDGHFVSTRRRGLGLGLSISRWVVERNGGRMTVWSSLGEGFHVQIALPRVD